MISGHFNCECTHTMRVGMVLVVRPYDTIYMYSDKHTRARDETIISPPNLSDGGSLRSLIILYHNECFYINSKAILLS